MPSEVGPAHPRHSALVRVTHWISALSFLVLVLSGIAILLAHPRLYWGEAGAVGDAFPDRPAPPLRARCSHPWPRALPAFPRRVGAVFTGLVYVGTGLAARHFGRNLLPARDQLTRARSGA